MDGLIPMVYKSLKKNKVRQQYECLSSGSAKTYNIADFYTKVDNHNLDHFSQKQYRTQEPERMSDLRGPHHRRYNSVHIGGNRSLEFAEDAPKSKQLMRFRSHRLFSCVTGA